MTAPVTRSSVCELTSLPRHAGEIPTCQVKLEDLQVAEFASWMDDHLMDLELGHRLFWTHQSTLHAIFHGSRRR